MLDKKASLEQVFREFLGPVALVVFPDLAKKGLGRDNIIPYIDSLKEDEIIDAYVYEKFKSAAEAILKD